MGRFFYIFLFINILLCEVLSEDSKNDEDFVPSKEWKVVKKGQKIPQGLHVRVNFETGITEAKLLDEQKENEKGQSLIALENAEPDDDVLSKETLTEKLKNIKSDEILNPDEIKKFKDKFRSYEQLKQDLGDLNLTPRIDAEIIAELLKEFKAVKKDDDYEIEVLRIMEDLEFLGHQIDNAVEFANQNGFNDVIYKSWNSTNDRIKQKSLTLLSSLVQNNGKVQIYCLETGCVNKILRLISTSTDEKVKNSGITAISSLLRRFPIAQTSFLENGGVTIFSNLFENESIKIQIKIATFFSDLLSEISDGKRNDDIVVSGQYKNNNLKQFLLENNWCKNLNKLLLSTVSVYNNDHDVVEKSLTSILNIVQNCHHQIDTNLLIKLKERYKKLALDDLSKMEEISNSDYFVEIFEMISKILNYKNVKTEL